MHAGLTLFALLDGCFPIGSLKRYSIWYIRPSPLYAGTPAYVMIPPFGTSNEESRTLHQ